MFYNGKFHREAFARSDESRWSFENVFPLKFLHFDQTIYSAEISNEQGGRRKFFINISHPKCFKTKNFNRFHCHKFIAICRGLFISFDDMPNAHIRGCYCMVRETATIEFFVWYFINPRVVPVLILFYGSGIVTSPASRWTGRYFDKVLCLVNVDDKSSQ